MVKRSKYNWSMVFFLTMFPLLGLIGTPIYIYMYGVVLFEPLLLVTFWFLSGMGITMGYHRLFAHKSYQTNVFLEWVLMIFGSIALENTILKWASDHRKHHSLSDTEHDPYSISKGFWYAHIGWILKNTNEEHNKITGVKDLEKKSAIIFQNKYYYHIAIIGGLFIPLLVGMFFGRPFGALFWGVFLRITLVHHATFFINSLCHYKGKQTYDTASSARDSWIVSLFTFGEGYHNYHHKFPSDFRNGVSLYAFDPSKWLISFLSFFKMATNLRRTKDVVIFKTKFEVLSSRLLNRLNKLSVFYQNIYKNRMDLLFKRADETFLSWKELEQDINSIPSIHTKESVKKYKNTIIQIFKDLNSISNELKTTN